MTMDISPDHVEYIAHTLKARAVTYHTAARDLNIHVSKSKQMLLDYYNVNKDRVDASFIVTGTRRGNTVVQILRSEADYASQTQDFDEIRTVHVYCLTLSKNVFLASEIALEELAHPLDMGSLSKYYELGLTKGTDVTVVHNSGAKTEKVTAKDTGKPKLEIKDSKTEKPRTKQEEPKRKLEYHSRKDKTTPSILSNYVSRKSESKIPAKREGNSKPMYQYKSRKTEQNQPKERVVMSMEEDIPEPEVVKAPAAMENLFLDDLSDFSDTNDDVEEPIMVENTEEEIHKPEKESPAPQVPEDSIFRTMASNNASNNPPQRSPTPPPQTTVDEDGYITTYRAKEVKEVKEPVRKAARESSGNKLKKTDGKKKQASLMSFFGKR